MTADMKMTDATLTMFQVTPATAHKLEAAVDRVADLLGVDERDVTKALNRASLGESAAVDIAGKPEKADRAVMAKVAESAPDIGAPVNRFADKVKAERASGTRECSRER
ncbi:MAG: hypothetical protein FJX23_03515 [Alphaproteobacteria bacterium]|nr:hypothetical protein [Alphaproteobacteria bacterium]